MKSCIFCGNEVSDSEQTGRKEEEEEEEEEE